MNFWCVNPNNQNTAVVAKCSLEIKIGLIFLILIRDEFGIVVREFDLSCLEGHKRRQNDQNYDQRPAVPQHLNGDSLPHR